MVIFSLANLKDWRKKPVSKLATNPTMCSKRPPQQIGRYRQLARGISRSDWVEECLGLFSPFELSLPKSQ